MATKRTFIKSDNAMIAKYYTSFGSTGKWEMQHGEYSPK